MKCIDSSSLDGTNPKRKRSSSFSGFSSISILGDTNDTKPSTASSSMSTLSTISFCSDSSLPHPASRLPPDVHVEGWMYWSTRSKDKQRMLHKLRLAAARHPQTELYDARCYTKVYAVLRSEFLSLYANQHTRQGHQDHQSEKPLVRIAVSCVSRSPSGAFLLRDPIGQEVELHVYDPTHDITQQWDRALEQATGMTLRHYKSFKNNVKHVPHSSLYLHDVRVPKRNLLHRTVEKVGSIRTKWDQRHT